MKDLQINSNGDLILSKHDIQLVSDKELTAQKVRLTLSTNKGEWLLNDDEGINFKAILVKNPNQDEILDTVRDGLRQIDETFQITEYNFETRGRHLVLTFTAENESGEEISLAVGNVQGPAEILVTSLSADEILNAGSAIEALCICDTDDDVLVGTYH